MTQTQVGELLERATADVHTTTDLVAGGIAAGRRRRRRELAVTLAGVVVAAGMVGGAVVALSGGGAGSEAVVADPSSSTGWTRTFRSPTVASTAPVPLDHGPFPVAPTAMAATLANLVQGAVSNPGDHQYRLGEADGWQSGSVDLAGGSVSVSYQRSTGPRCDGDLARGNTGCTALGDGFFLSTYSAQVTTVGQGLTGVRDIGVTYYTPDGFKINATASNAGSDDPTHQTADEPVLSIAELTAIAEDPIWR